MAAEDELPQSIRDLNEALKALNNTVETSSQREAKFRARVKATDEKLEELAKAAQGSAKKLKEYEETKAAYEKDNARRARSLAQEQLAAEKETKTLAFQFMKAAGASVENQKALLVWGGRLKATGDTLANIGGSMGKFAAGLAQGDTKFTSLNPLIDSVVGAFGKMAESIPYVGGLLSGAMKLAAEGAKFMTQQLQTATESFQQVSRAGASGADGIEGLMRQFQTSGMTLEGFKKAIITNSSTLASFAGTAGKGAEAFSKISQDIIDSGAGDYLRRLGYTADEMGESTARFIGQQQRLGIAQGKSFKELAQGSAAYMKELDLIAKLTGQSREAQQEAINAQLREGRFLSTMRIMEREGRGTQAKELQKLSLATGAYNDELAAAIRDASSGIIDSDVVKQFTVAGVDILGAVEKVKTGGLTAEQAFRNLQGQVNRVLPQQESFAQYLDSGNKTFPTLYKNVDFAAATFDEAGAKKEQENVQTNKLTGNAADAQKSLEQMSRQISALATTILPNFSAVIAKTTDVMNQGLQKMGVAPVGTTGGAGGARGAGGGAAPVAGGGGKGFFSRLFGGGGAGGGAGGGLSDYLVFGGNTGSQANFEALDTDFKNRFVAMAQEYTQMTGDKLRINSAYRSAEEQAALMARGGNGANPIAQPGISLHQRGIAVDVNSDQRRKLEGLGLLGKYNMAGLANDPPHIQSLAMGGVATGPKSGYAATLHGNEAVVPLPDGRTIPVEMPSLSNNIEQQVSMMGAQLATLQEMVRYMRDNNAISTKILQAANN